MLRRATASGTGLRGFSVHGAAGENDRDLGQSRLRLERFQLFQCHFPDVAVFTQLAVGHGENHNSRHLSVLLGTYGTGQAELQGHLSHSFAS
jgi:hypothetical protein